MACRLQSRLSCGVPSCRHGSPCRIAAGGRSAEPPLDSVAAGQLRRIPRSARSLSLRSPAVGSGVGLRRTSRVDDVPMPGPDEHGSISTSVAGAAVTTVSDPHLILVRPVTPRTPQGCEECLSHGTPWVHLRLCLTCGHVGCCDSSPMRHARGHAYAIGHPIVKSFEPGEDWRWCYVDESYV
jgi:Zn-finger in ubiquitin-hydrolases and other protein